MSIRYVHHHVAELSGLIRVEWLEQLPPLAIGNPPAVDLIRKGNQVAAFRRGILPSSVTVPTRVPPSDTIVFSIRPGHFPSSSKRGNQRST
ncbi:MAG: hypothetical protein AAB177_01395 [Nitrospirota bacterium]